MQKGRLPSPGELMRLQSSCCSGHAGRSPEQQRWLTSALAATQRVGQADVHPTAEALGSSVGAPSSPGQLVGETAGALQSLVQLQGCPGCPACQHITLECLGTLHCLKLCTLAGLHTLCRMPCLSGYLLYFVSQAWDGTHRSDNNE